MNYNKSNKGLRAVAVILAIVLVLAAVAGVVAYFSDWFTDWSKFQPEQQEEQLPDEEEGEDTASVGGGAIIGESVGNGVKLMSAKIAAADYEEYGISPMAETAYTLTATITPDNADNKAVDWSVVFVNPSSEWATGKTVTDYVTVTPTSDGALTANVECKQAFGEQIKVVVTSRDNESATASCTVDYAQRVTKLVGGNVFYLLVSSDESGNGNLFNSKGGFLSEEDLKDFILFPTFSDVYTVEDNFTYTLTFTQPEDYRSATGKFTSWRSGPTATVTFGELVEDQNYAEALSADISGSDNSNLGYGMYMIMSFMIESVTGEADSSFASAYNNCLQILKSNPDMSVMDVTLSAVGEYSSFSKTVSLRPSADDLTVLAESVSLNHSNFVF